MGAQAQAALRYMTVGNFGFNSPAQQHHQQTRHTLTNYIFLEQTATTAITQVYNTLERFIDGKAYDGSQFVYQHQWVKQGGRWLWQKILACQQGHGHLGGFPAVGSFDNYLAGLGRRLGNVGSPSAVVGSKILLNPQVARVPPLAIASIGDNTLTAAITMLWDRFEIIERFALYPFLADSTRYYAPKGFLWGDLWADNATFCIGGYHNVSLPVPDWDSIHEGTAGGGPAGSAVETALGRAERRNNEALQRQLDVQQARQSELQRRSQKF